MLAWARNDAGMTLSMAAERSGYTLHQLEAWESGALVPTLKEAERLAGMYHRPYSVLFMEEAPVSDALSKEYRRLPGVKPGKESPELRFALRDMIQRRCVAMNLLAEMDNEPTSFTLHASISNDTAIVARELRNLLGISSATQKGWGNELQAWGAWSDAVEGLGVLVFQFSNVRIDEARGLSLLRFPLPVIGVNAKEVPLSKPFTLVHELVHLMLANAHEEVSAIDENRSSSDWNELERFVDEVAGQVLVPRDELLSEHLVFTHKGDWGREDINWLARRYTVTPTAMATRLLKYGKCRPAAYSRWKEDRANWQDNPLPKSKFGSATQSEKVLHRVGKSFARIVVEALALERITSTDAANYLNVNFEQVQTLHRHL